MRKVTQYLVCIALLAASTASHAVALQSGDILQISAGSYVEGMWGGIPGFYDNASLVGQNGLIIGTAQPGIPGIDQTWTSNINSVTGNHRTTTAVTVIDGSTLDFSGWVMTLFASDDYAFGAQQNIATYTFDGTNFTLDYFWDYTDNGGNPLGGVSVSEYHLHLVGTVVPIPATVWLLGSGLLGLLGFARRKKPA